MNKKSIYKILAVAVLAVLMQSCFTAKNYERPKVATENLYRTETALKDSISLADVSWDKLFTDAILQDYIKKGLQNNLDIRIAMQTIAAAEANMKQGKAGYIPKCKSRSRLDSWAVVKKQPVWCHSERQKYRYLPTSSQSFLGS